jgi:hypothetical protein
MILNTILQMTSDTALSALAMNAVNGAKITAVIQNAHSHVTMTANAQMIRLCMAIGSDQNAAKTTTSMLRDAVLIDPDVCTSLITVVNALQTRSTSNVDQRHLMGMR